MSGAGHGRPERGHLASAYSSSFGRLDMSIVPKALPCILDYKMVTLGVLYVECKTDMSVVLTVKSSLDSSHDN